MSLFRRDVPPTAPKPDLYRFLLQFGRVGIVSDGLNLRGEIAGNTTTGLNTVTSQWVYQGFSGIPGLSTVSGLQIPQPGRVWLSPGILDYPQGQNYSGTVGQRSARFGFPFQQSALNGWLPDTNGFTAFSFSLGQYYPTATGGPNTRTQQGSLVISEYPITSASTVWLPPWFTFGQITDAVSGYSLVANTAGFTFTGYQLDSLFQVDNGPWDGVSAYGPVVWCYGERYDPSSSTKYQQFYTSNTGVVRFPTPITSPSVSVATFPTNPGIHLFLGGSTPLTAQRGTDSGNRIGVTILMFEPLNNGIIQRIANEVLLFNNGIRS